MLKEGWVCLQGGDSLPAALDFPRRLWQLYPVACFSSPPAKGHVLKAAAGFGDIKSRGRRKQPAQLRSWPCQGTHVCGL